jgi:hypothetical protein
MDGSRFPGATWASSHVYGQCSINHTKKLMYIKIPKCASSWCDQYLANLGSTSLDNTWHGGNFTDPLLSDYQPIVILRDPIQRWISVMPAREKLPTVMKSESELASIRSHLKDFLVDEHLAPQTDFISGVDLSRAVFFWCDDNLDKKFSEFIGQSELGNVAVPEKLNVGPEDTVKQCWQLLLERDDFRNEFTNLYQNDYKLISGTKFYPHQNHC